PPELEAGERVGDREPHDESEQGGHRRLPDGEPHDPPQRGIAEHLAELGEIPSPAGTEAEVDDRPDGHDEEHREERGGDRGEREARRDPQPWCRTAGWAHWVPPLSAGRRRSTRGSSGRARRRWWRCRAG